MDSNQKDDNVKGLSAQAKNKTPLVPIGDFLDENYFLEYKKVYKVYECLIAALYMHYRDPDSEEGQIALKRIEVLLRVLPNSEKFTKKDIFADKYFEISSFLSGEKDEWSIEKKNPLGQFKLPVFDNGGWLEVPGDSILWQTYDQIRKELEGDFERLKRMENKIRYIYINRLINNLLDKNHFDIEITLEQLEELELPIIEDERNSLLDAQKNKDGKAPEHGKANEMLMKDLSKLEDLVVEDPDLLAFLNGDDVEAIPQGFKEYIKFLVQQAGTEDLNPWLDAWVAGDTENLSPTNGLILNRDVPLIDFSQEDLGEKMTENIINLSAFANDIDFIKLNEEGPGVRKIFALQGVGEETNSLYKRENKKWILHEFVEDPHAFDYLDGDSWESAEGLLVPDEFVEAWDFSQESGKPLYENIVRGYEMGKSSKEMIRKIEKS